MNNSKCISLNKDPVQITTTYMILINEIIILYWKLSIYTSDFAPSNTQKELAMIK